jgi:hypothetical protein
MSKMSVIRVVISVIRVRVSFYDKIIDIHFKAGVKSAWIIIPTFQTIYILTPDLKVLTFTQGTVKDPATGIKVEMNEIFY